MSRLFTFARAALLTGAMLLAAPVALAEECYTAIGTVIEQNDEVKVQVGEEVYDLLDGAEMLSDGVIELNDQILVGKMRTNPRTVVALEDTHF